MLNSILIIFLINETSKRSTSWFKLQIKFNLRRILFFLLIHNVIIILTNVLVWLYIEQSLFCEIAAILGSSMFFHEFLDTSVFSKIMLNNVMVGVFLLKLVSERVLTSKCKILVLELNFKIKSSQSFYLKSFIKTKLNYIFYNQSTTSLYNQNNSILLPFTPMALWKQWGI